MDSYLDEWQSQRKFNTLLMGIFAALALALAMMGIYGVLSNLLASRVREIFLRMAIGATAGEIARIVLLQSMLPETIGLALGLGGTFAVTRFLEAFLFHVHARDPLTLSGIHHSADFTGRDLRAFAPGHEHRLHRGPARSIESQSPRTSAAFRRLESRLFLQQTAIIARMQYDRARFDSRRTNRALPPSDSEPTAAAGCRDWCRRSE
jgi:ABC-type antimicrobial peptide transport system permease subunit